MTMRMGAGWSGWGWTLVVGIAVGCSAPSDHDAGVTDAGIVDAAATDRGGGDAVVDAGGIDTAARDIGAVDVGARDRVATPCDQVDGGRLDERGFCIRVPGSRSIPVEQGGGGTMEMDTPETDHVCTLTHDGVDGFVYVQANPVECFFVAGCVYETEGMWISIDGEVSPVDGAYDFGGRHANNFIDVEYGGRYYRLNHSSFGWGFRACLPPDCLQLFEADGETLIDDGCTAERTSPQVCVEVARDGTVAPLVDTFEPCPGDPNIDAG